jgi:hypothetical protein
MMATIPIQLNDTDLQKIDLSSSRIRIVDAILYLYNTTNFKVVFMKKRKEQKKGHKMRLITSFPSLSLD